MSKRTSLMTAGTLLLLTCLMGTRAQSSPPSAPKSRCSALAAPHPAKAKARHLVQRGTKAFHASAFEDAARLLEEAVREDPTLVAAWANLSAVRIRRCEASGARFAALVARSLDAELLAAAKNLTMASKLRCPETTPSSHRRRQDQILKDPSQSASWVALADQLQGEGEHLLAAFFLEQALARNHETSTLQRLLGQLEAAGLVRSALECAALQGLDDQRTKRWRAQLEALAPDARRIADQIAPQLGALSDTEHKGLERMAEILLLQLSDRETAQTSLEKLIGFGELRTIAGVWGHVQAHHEWALVEPPHEPTAPLAILRRFPGDLQLALFSWYGPPAGPAAGRLIEQMLVERLPEQRSAWLPCPKQAEGLHCQEARFGIDAGGQGRTSVVISLLSPQENPGGVLAVVSLIGDGGCGPTCHARAETARAKLLATLAPAKQLSPMPEKWTLPIPVAWQNESYQSENRNPWRRFTLDGGLVVELPPGLCATKGRTREMFATAAPQARLWMRGRFEDREKRRVVVGDSSRAGWIEQRSETGLTTDLFDDPEHQLRPPGDPKADFVATADLSVALRKAGGNGYGLVARFHGKTFAGEWLVLRRLLAGQVVDVYLPIAEGSASLSLLWIAITIREEIAEATPPLVDLSTQYEISFRRLHTHGVHAEPREGVLFAADAELPVPRGFQVSISANSRSGFPVKMRAKEGGARITLFRWPASEGGTHTRRQAQADREMGAKKTSAWQRKRRSRGGTTFYTLISPTAGDASSAICAVLLLPDDAASRDAYFLRLDPGTEVSASHVSDLCALLASMRYHQR